LGNWIAIEANSNSGKEDRKIVPNIIDVLLCIKKLVEVCNAIVRNKLDWSSARGGDQEGLQSNRHSDLLQYLDQGKGL